MKRVKKRHIYLKVSPIREEKTSFSSSDLFFTVKVLFEILFGLTSFSQTFLKVEKSNRDEFIVSVNQTYLRETLSVLTVLNEMQGQRVSVVVINVSRTKRDAVKGHL